MLHFLVYFKTLFMPSHTIIKYVTFYFMKGFKIYFLNITQFISKKAQNLLQIFWKIKKTEAFAIKWLSERFSCEILEIIEKR